MLTLGVASTLALILGAVGLYGVLSYVVAQRTREIGVRLALGAQAEQVRRMVVAQGAASSSSASLHWHRRGARRHARARQPALRRRAVDAATFASMSVSMLAIGLLASYLPARRASRIDPIVLLRPE